MRDVYEGMEDVCNDMRDVSTGIYSYKRTCTGYVRISYLLHEDVIVMRLHVLQLPIL